MRFSAVAIFVAILVLGGCQTTRPTMGEMRDSARVAMQEEDGKEVAVSDPDYDPNKMICKTTDVTGSRLRKTKDCRTAEQWRDSMTNASRSINDVKDAKGARGAQQY